ncbi:NADP-dependent glyceraldehyde-3-phosphate dehydrogenase [Alicyclobacillus pomorum]|jgi:glyceraldehyde-3-phosphate dehydrogenase (NADP+)|uniref:NADP-dependent glyceraldehyde-3-phosphate dehydrogenase n=1 Tax=Alicyclobacillus pomorum TaxID=204470 RepID=UPI000424C279|nr:NADP-dependent glyceraldehyde-3-phosphate dehydrogenase [Alicyclobacillus pomorum]
MQQVLDGVIDYHFLLNGNWGQSASNRFIDVVSPNDGCVAGRIPAMTKEEVDLAVQGAVQAQKQWGLLPVHERGQLLLNWADELAMMSDEIAEMIMKEVGKTYSAAKNEVLRTSDLIRYTVEEGKRIHGEVMTGDSFQGSNANKVAIVRKEPLGVILAISPFNYPVNLSAAKIAPALISGNTVILKPATQGSISALLMAKALDKVGLPKGVLNVVTGKGSEIGDYLVTHPSIRMISFTGGTKTGRDIAKKATMIPLVLELGGKDPAIVLEDANLDKAARHIVSGAFSYSGQRCTAIKRVLVMDSVADSLIEKVKQQVEKLTVGMPEQDAAITPLIDASSADFVNDLILDALNKGAIPITEYRRVGNLIYPLVLDHVTQDMKVAWEEPFGPVLPIIRVKNEQEAVEIANASEYGLQASIFTQDIDKAFHLASKLEVGSVQINGRTERGPDHFPFLGVKNSGMGVQGVRKSIESMTRDKVLVLNL